MTNSTQPHRTGLEDQPVRRMLDEKTIAIIEEALRSLGPYGEVRLVVEKGRLRFIVTHKSHDLLKWLPGTFAARADDQE